MSLQAPKKEIMEIDASFEMDKVTLLKKTVDDIEFSLPYGWKKIGRKRSNKDHWDFYLISSDNKKLRSNAEVKRYVENNPNVKCDLSVTNTKWPLKNLEIPKPVQENPKTDPFIKTKANIVVPKLIVPKLLKSPKKSLSTEAKINKGKSPKKLPEFEEEQTSDALGSNDENSGSESDSSDDNEGFRVPDFMKKLKPSRQIIDKYSPIVKLEPLPDSISSNKPRFEPPVSDFKKKELKPARQIINKLSPIVKLELLPDSISSKKPRFESPVKTNDGISSKQLTPDKTKRYLVDSDDEKILQDSDYEEEPLSDSISIKNPRFEICGGIKFKKFDTEENEIRKSGRSRKIPARLRDWSDSDSDSELTPKKRRKILKEKSVKSKINLSLFDCDDVIEYSLPFGWKKVCKKRKNSDTRNWDVYIINSDGKRFRSTVEVERHLSQNPNEDCDLSVTNTILPSELREQKSLISKEDETNITGKKKPSTYGMISMVSTALEKDSSDQESDSDSTEKGFKVDIKSEPNQGNLSRGIDNKIV